MELLEDRPYSGNTFHLSVQFIIQESINLAE